MRLLVAALVAGTAIVAAGCNVDRETGQGGLGDLVQGRLGDLDGTQHSVLVPTGELTVTLTDGQDEVGATEAADGQEHPAPAGTQWVGVDWRFAPGADFDPLQRTLMDDPAERTTLRLTTGDATVDLGDAPGATGTPGDTRTSGVVYVATEDGEAPVLEVTFAGASVRLDTGSGTLEGEHAGALADLAEPTVADCPPLRPDGSGAAALTCSYVVTQVPYLAGRGWSADGWTVAQVETRADMFELDRSAYAVQGVADDSGFEGTGSAGPGAEPVVVDERLDSLVTRVVAEATPARLRIARELQGARTSGPGPDDARLTVSATVDLD